MMVVEVITMKADKNDHGTRLAQEIIQFAKNKNMKVRKKRTSTSKNTTVKSG